MQKFFEKNCFYIRFHCAVLLNYLKKAVKYANNKNMDTAKIRIRLFFCVGIVLSLLLLPGHCFASSGMSEAEIRVCREKLITEAKKYVGAPYVRGATGPDAFDCSGLVYFVAREAIQVQLPRTVKAMYGYSQIIPDNKLEPGDLVFFRTTGDGSISHVGLYVGNMQFISAASDGPNTGVILSSLRENYWKTHYAASGKFLGDSRLYEEDTASISGKTASSSPKKSRPSGSSHSGSSSSRTGNAFLDNLFFDANLTFDWSVFTEKRFMPNFRGLSTQLNVVYEGKTLSPGLGTMLRWNFGVKSFQIPLLFSLYFGDYVRAYAGPVFTVGTSYAPDTDDEIKASIFPGIIGVSFMTPSLTKGDVKVRIMQDINYSVFNNTDGAALSPLRSAASGLEFSTGVSVTLPIRTFFK